MKGGLYCYLIADILTKVLQRCSLSSLLPNIYWNTLKTQHLIKCQFLPEDQIISVIDNKMDKSDQLPCIQYKKQIVLA